MNARVNDLAPAKAATREAALDLLNMGELAYSGLMDAVDIMQALRELASGMDGASQEQLSKRMQVIHRLAHHGVLSINSMSDTIGYERDEAQAALDGAQ